MKNGILYGVGMGPGDPELVTLKALRIIKECPVIAVPCKDKKDSAAYQIVSQVMNGLDEKVILELDMPMTKNQEIIDKKHRECANKVIEYLKNGKSVAFLTLGDPTVYSTHLYINRLVEKEGIETKIISGVTSFCAASAALNTGLVEQGEMLHIVPASYPVDEALEFSGTKVLMKAGRNLPKIKEQLRQMDCEAVLVENCGMENEKIYHCLEKIPESTGYFSLMIVK